MWISKKKFEDIEDRLFLLENPYKYEIGFLFNDCKIISRDYKYGLDEFGNFIKTKFYVAYNDTQKRLVEYTENRIRTIIDSNYEKI